MTVFILRLPSSQTKCRVPRGIPSMRAGEQSLLNFDGRPRTHPLRVIPGYFSKIKLITSQTSSHLATTLERANKYLEPNGWRKRLGLGVYPWRIQGAVFCLVFATQKEGKAGRRWGETFIARRFGGRAESGLSLPSKFSLNAGPALRATAPPRAGGGGGGWTPLSPPPEREGGGGGTSSKNWCFSGERGPQVSWMPKSANSGASALISAWSENSIVPAVGAQG